MERLLYEPRLKALKTWQANISHVHQLQGFSSIHTLIIPFVFPSQLTHI